MPDRPRPAAVEDWHSDDDRHRGAPSAVSAAAAAAAAAAATRPQPPATPSRSLKHGPSAAGEKPVPSHPGDSSQSRAAQASAAPPPRSTRATAAARQPASPPVRPAQSNTKKPVDHRHDRARSRSQTVTPAPSTRSDKCHDAPCRNPGCQSSRPERRRYTLYAQVPPHHYGRDMPPPPPPPPLPRSASRSSRPQSFHAGMPMSYHPAHPGPPPAQSAYYGAGYGHPYAQPSYAAAPASYVSPSPAAPPPPSPPSPSGYGYPGYPGYPGGAISARMPNPNVAGIEAPKLAPHPALTIRTSARRPDVRSLPGAYPDDRSLPGAYPGDRSLPGAYPDEPETTSESESSGHDSEEERYQRRKAAERQQRRTSFAEPRSKSRPQNTSRAREASATMIAQSSHPRRPSMSKSYHTDSYLPTRRHSIRDPRQDRPQPAPCSDTVLDYPSSDHFDSDRTARAVVRARHSAPPSKAHSRRQSFSTNASSGGTKATTLSSGTDYYQSAIEQDSLGSRVVYLSQEEQAALIKLHERQKLHDPYDEQERLNAMRWQAAVDHQREMSGGIDAYEMSAENIKNLNRKSNSHTQSRISGRSGKSAASGSKASRSNDVTILLSGSNFLQLDEDMGAKFQTGEDGEVQVVVSNGRQVEYNTSSKGSSRSRISRARARDHIPEADEGGYERAI